MLAFSSAYSTHALLYLLLLIAVYKEIGLFEQRSTAALWAHPWAAGVSREGSGKAVTTKQKWLLLQFLGFPCR